MQEEPEIVTGTRNRKKRFVEDDEFDNQCSSEEYESSKVLKQEKRSANVTDNSTQNSSN